MIAKYGLKYVKNGIKNMGTVLPQSESLRRAVQWISEELKVDENQDKMKLLNEATLKFDLSPSDGNFLYNMYKQS